MRLCLVFITWLLAAVGTPAASIKMPIEVVGEAGTSVSVPVRLAEGSAVKVRSVYLQVHGLAFADMASVRLNGAAWVPLNNASVNVAEPGRSYGGIGGGFATLKMTLAVPAGSVVEGENTISFRFNRTDGVVSGFRVLALNFLTADGRPVLAETNFAQEDPNEWTAPLSAAEQIAAGKRLWHSAALVANGLPGAKPIHAHCADCHAQDGRDLKYFNFSNPSIVARARFHGLSEEEGRQIASYIRSLSAPNPGRPWNPPYQPGPGMDSKPVEEWAAGAGLEQVLDRDADTLPYLFPAKGKAGEMAITQAAFRPDGNLDAREIPIAMQLPDWNHWLPRVHPMDAFPGRFESSGFARMYGDAGSSGADAAFFEGWVKSREKFLAPHLSETSDKWTLELGNVFYSAELWQLVKTWEMMQEQYGAQRRWPNMVPAETAPAAAHIPDGPSGMGGSALTNEYYSNAWYEVQILLNDGGHRHHARTPVDWVYVIGRFRQLQAQSKRPESGRLLVAIIKALQSTDAGAGPQNLAEGWRPDQNVDPRIMVSPGWEAAFEDLPVGLKREITQAMLGAWLEKTLEYPTVSYFQRGLGSGSYRLPEEFLDISGGKVWAAAPEFRAAGVAPRMTQRLEDWGRAYSSMAGLFHY